jgi:hypothetical protein
MLQNTARSDLVYLLKVSGIIPQTHFADRLGFINKSRLEENFCVHLGESEDDSSEDSSDFDLEEPSPRKFVARNRTDISLSASPNPHGLPPKFSQLPVQMPTGYKKEDFDRMNGNRESIGDRRALWRLLGLTCVIPDFFDGSRRRPKTEPLRSAAAIRIFDDGEEDLGEHVASAKSLRQSDQRTGAEETAENHTNDTEDANLLQCVASKLAEEDSDAINT